MIKYADYSGPQGPYAVVDGQIERIDHEVARRLSQQAHLAALGSPEFARAQQAAHDAALVGSRR